MVTRGCNEIMLARVAVVPNSLGADINQHVECYCLFLYFFNVPSTLVIKIIIIVISTMISIIIVISFIVVSSISVFNFLA